MLSPLPFRSWATGTGIRAGLCTGLALGCPTSAELIFLEAIWVRAGSYLFYQSNFFNVRTINKWLRGKKFSICSPTPINKVIAFSWGRGAGRRFRGNCSTFVWHVLNGLPSKIRHKKKGPCQSTGLRWAVNVPLSIRAITAFLDGWGAAGGRWGAAAIIRLFLDFLILYKWHIVSWRIWFIIIWI